jgi:hypothetical protein
VDADFPAAHSMDSEWFAVDKGGHVAHFSTGEAGAQPEDAVLVDDPGELAEKLRAVLPRTEIVYDFRGHFKPGPLGSEGTHWATGYLVGDLFLFFLRSLEPVRAELERGRARQVRSRGPTAVVMQKSAVRRLTKRLHADGVCLGCFFHTDDPEAPPSAAEMGLFAYSHMIGNWVSGPYGLEQRPFCPAHIDQLPPALRDEVRLIEFRGLRFAETLHLQPVEHGLCSSWEPAYLTSDGKRVRKNVDAIAAAYAPDEYEEWYANTVGDDVEFLRGIRVDPPE